jgi:hypothetical protein
MTFRLKRGGCVIVTKVSGRVAILCLTAFLGACRNLPEPYSPPRQRVLIQPERPFRLSRVLSMDESDAPTRFVRDIAPGLSGGWRWTGQRPAIKVFMRANAGVHYVIDFAVPEVTFKVTGPVTLSFFVNDRLLDAVRYASPGDQHFEKPVPAEWIPVNAESTVGAEIDKVWTAPTDGARLGFVLVRMGLAQR